MKVIIIAAIAENGAIGKNNTLIWRLPNDMKFFKATTTGHCVITGRKNYESIPEKFRPLPDRLNLLITRNDNHTFGIPAFNSIANAINYAAKECTDKNVFIIGGGEIYQQSMDLADEMFITMVHETFPDADTFFPKIDTAQWNVTTVQPLYKIDEKHKHAFTILHYTKK